jgi:4-amino-4-deoxy-L-arabinose transferase-like glycosyltransferase
MTGDPIAPPGAGESPSGHRGWQALALGAALAFALLALDAARLETPTIDEFAHVPAGHAVLVHGNLDLYSKNPPLGKALLAAPNVLLRSVRVPPPQEPSFGWGPWQYGRRFMKANSASYFSLFTTSRAVVIVFALLAGGIVFLWTRALFGERAAATSSALFLLCPTVLAHGHLATLDVLCATTIAGSLLALRSALAGDGLPRFVGVGGVLGLALLVKFSGLLLVPVFALLVLLARGRRVGRALGELAVVFGMAAVVVNGGMAFRGSFAPLGEFAFGSDFARSLQRVLPAGTPVPAPLDYVRGFDAQKRDVERAEFPSYFRGSWSREGVWYYEAAALLVKTPLPLLALLGFTPFALWRQRLPGHELALLGAPILVLGLLLTGLNSLNVGTRYLLPLYPFAFIAMGAAFARGGRATSISAVALVALIAALAIRVHPGYLGFFNALAGGPDGGHRFLLDSNLDWGQDLYRLPRALERLDPQGEAPLQLLYFGHVEPELYGLEFTLPEEGAPGWVAASVSYLEGFAYPAPAPGRRSTRVPRDALAWLEGQEPVARLGSIWLFDRRGADAPQR